VRREPDILVVGAGPTGLALALQAHLHGAAVRIVERRPAAFRPSRALILHPRTLEVLRPLGVTDALLARADVAPEARLHLGDRVARVHLDELSLPDAAFPHLTLVRQMEVETVLAQRLAEVGVEVERGTELIDASDGAESVGALLQSASGVDRIECAFVAGCDGQSSRVRHSAGIDWRGESYNEEVVLADAEIDADLAAGLAHVIPGRAGLLFLFALGELATWRILATRPARRDRLSFGEPGSPVPPSELQALLDEAGLKVGIHHVAWSARYRLQHRLADQFRRGRLFVAGDAAHASSPATGQGMNTGIQDALNLGWKLAFATSASHQPLLLDSYDLERRPMVRRVLWLTHLVFWAEASTAPLPSLLRAVAASLGASAASSLLSRRWLVGQTLGVVSQLRAGYRRSPLSVDGEPRPAAAPRAGQRLPDATVTVDGQPARLHSLLARPGVHILLDRDAAPIDRLEFGRQVTVHRLTSTPGTGVRAVRPDGYVGFTCRTADVTQLAAWLAGIGASQPVAARSDLAAMDVAPQNSGT
jgi:2-polyprenyl-6-methoxyphenol hydroxylase-like FAD-dependent oxidoreductase